MNVFRWLEAQLAAGRISLLECGGRVRLLEIYRRRNELSRGAIAWFADLDLWKVLPRPDGLEGIIFTAGYSIENDLYAGSDLEALLEKSERKDEPAKHKALVRAACRWFAFEVGESMAGREALVGANLHSVIDENSADLSRKFLQSRSYVEPDPEFVDRIHADYQLTLRGKSLFEALMMVTSAKSRPLKYGHDKLIDLCLKLYAAKNPYVNRILADVRAALAGEQA